MNILIVDDEILIASGLCHIIKKMDIHIDHINFSLNAEDALRKMKTLPFDLCLVDICMPDMDGLQLIKQSKQEKLCSNFCIISGHADFEYARNALRLGVKDYLLKPVDKTMLWDMLQRFELSASIKIVKNKTANPYVKQMLAIVSREYAHDIPLTELAEKISINKDYAGKLFKTHTGFSFTEYMNRYKLDKIISRMKEEPAANIEELAINNGFYDSRNFYRVFKKYFHMTPSEYREHHLSD